MKHPSYHINLKLVALEMSMPLQLNCWITMNPVALYQWNQSQCCTSIKTSSCWPQSVSLWWEFQVQNHQSSLCWLYLPTIEFCPSWFPCSNFDDVYVVAHCCPRSFPATAVEDPWNTVQIMLVAYRNSGACGEKLGPDAGTSAVLIVRSVFSKMCYEKTQN